MIQGSPHLVQCSAIVHVCSGTSQIKINEPEVPQQYPANLTEQIIMASPQSSPSAANLNLGIPEGRCSAGWGADIQYCLMYGVHRVLSCILVLVSSCLVSGIQGVELYAAGIYRVLSYVLEVAAGN